MLSTRICEKWVYNQFSTDPTMISLVAGRIYAYEVSQTNPIPVETRYVLYANLSALDVMGVGPRILMDNLIYVVRAVIESTSFSPLEPVAARIHELLHGKEGSTADGQVIACVRERPFSLADTTNGRKFRHLGGTYRFYTIKQ